MADHPMNPDSVNPESVNPEIRLLDGYWYQQRPLEHYRWMRDNAPVYRDEDAGVWGVTRHEDVQRVSRSPKIFCSGKGSRPDHWNPSMINLDDPEHKRRRNLVNRGFTKKRVDDHEPKIREIVNELIDRVAPRGECEFVFDVAAHLPMIVIGDMLGVRPEDRDRLLTWSDDLVKACTATAPDEIRERAMQSAGEYTAYTLDVVRDRRAKPQQDDLISVLVHAELGGEKLDDEALIQESLLILVGGDETTRHVISEGMEALIRHPDQRRRLIENPTGIPLAVEEMLRWVSPIKNMNRTALRDVELRGEKIREGDKVLLLYPSANRDDRAFDDPDVFDVRRDPNDHVAFGGYGAHFCLGSSLARLELRIMFETLLERLPDLEIATSEPLPLRPNNFIVGIEEMPVTFTPR